MKSLLEAPEYKFLRGKVIKELGIRCYDKTLDVGAGDHLRFRFDDGTEIYLLDLANQCCETRYMRTDDDLSSFIGSILLGIDLKDVDPKDELEDDNDNCHEIQFVEIRTSRGSFVLSNHNIHNGCYSGFRVDISVIEEE